MSTAHGAVPRFTVTGSRNGSPIVVSWSPGHFGGDPPTVELLLAEVEIAQASTGDYICEPGLASILSRAAGNPLHDPEASYALVERVLDAVRNIEAEPADLQATLKKTKQDPSAATRKEPQRAHRC